MYVRACLSFEGRCAEAIRFYRNALGAEVQLLMRHGDNPEPPPSGALPPGAEDRIRHASLRVGDTIVMASDNHCGGKPRFEGFSLSLAVPTDAAAEQALGRLCDGGQLRMPLARTFWSSRVGMLVDRFGVSWMVTVPA